MNRWLLIGSLAALMIGSTGCLHHNVNKGGCAGGACATGGCASGDCTSGTCSTGGCSAKGLFAKLGGAACSTCGPAGCNSCNGGPCGAGPLGWQQGALDYSSHLQPGLLGHHAPARLNNLPFTPGPPTPQVGYPYYTVRGPRDFLVDNPPTIGR